jgi:hypothetical protein
MTGLFILHTFQELLLDRCMKRAQPRWFHKSYDNFKDAFIEMNSPDHRIYFRDLAWNSGFVVNIFRSYITSANEDILAVKYPLLNDYPPNYMAGVYLYFNNNEISLQHILDTGIDFSGSVTISKTGDILLLATKQQLARKGVGVEMFKRKGMHLNREMLPPKRKGPSR